jgi:hypothetical protein
MDNGEYEEFQLNCSLVEYEVPKKEKTTKKDDVEIKLEEKTNTDSGIITKHAIAVKGDNFYHGCYLPSKELERVHKQWNGTLHDINHMGTSHLMGLGIVPDIRFFVGYQDNVTYNSETKQVEMDIHIDENTLYGKAWKSYVTLCKKAGQTPNVSVTFMAQRGSGKAKDVVTNYAEYGYKGDETVTYIKDMKPIALSTVLKGACSDKEGCGIESSNTSDMSETESDKEQKIKDYEEEKRKLIEELKKLDKEE